MLPTYPNTKHKFSNSTDVGIENFQFTTYATLDPECYLVSPPDDYNCIFPVDLQSPASVKKPKLWLMCCPMSRQPILLLGQRGDWATFVETEPGRGALSLHESRVTAILTLLQYYIRHEPPTSLCLNCYKHHPGHACPDPKRDFLILINAAANLPRSDPRHFKSASCNSCNKVHAPTRGRCLANRQESS